MSLQQLQGDTQQLMPASVSQNGPIFHGGLLQQPGPGMSILQPSPPSVGPYPPSGIGSIGGQLPLPDFGSRPPFITPLPDPHNPRYMFGDLKTRIEGLGDKFGSFGETLGGFGEQLTGYQDALGSFNEQVGGMGKQFETITNRLDSVDKGLGSLGNQIASLENMQKAQPQQVMQPQQRSYNPFGFGSFGGLGSLFGRRY